MTTELIQWEYGMVDDVFYTSSELLKFLNKMGQEGWENYQIVSVSTVHKTFYFKRPIIQSPDKQEP